LELDSFILDGFHLVEDFVANNVVGDLGSGLVHLIYLFASTPVWCSYALHKGP